MPASATASAESEAALGEFTHRQILKVMSVLLVSLFVACISGTVISTALPTIVGDLGGQDQLAWVASAGLLTTTASTPLWGKLSDLYGRKRLFRLALIVFAVSSALAGLSQTMGQLIAARAAQGVGVGGITALTQAIMADVTTPRTRGRYSGWIGSAFGVATVAGPLIGGFLVGSDALGWRWTFYVGIPFAIAALVMVERVLKLPYVRRTVHVDYLGAALISGAVTAVLLALSLGGQKWAWNSGTTYTLAALFVVLGAGAVWQEHRAVQPILPPHLFHSRTFNLAGAGSFFVGFSMYGAMIYLPQYLQIVRGMSPTRSGLMTLPMVLGMLSASIVSGRLITRFGRWKVFPLIGLPLIALGMFLLSGMDVGTPLPFAGLHMLVLGVGLGLSNQVLVLAIQNGADPDDIGIATSAASFFRSMGGAVGVAVLGAVLSARLDSGIPALMRERDVAPPNGTDLGDLLGSPSAIQALDAPLRDAVIDGFTQGLHTVFVVGAPVTLIGFLAVLAIRESVLRDGDDGDDAAAEPADGEPSPTADRAKAGTPG
ncbi:MFS transporter [Yinghuangia sp. ASG 101]|uniref:MDR family MFS transporter n=1 Tax=Yinghuangia sp. ASG 101 TaxID=2896848 RepID=UPI001E5D275D|nr:MDR family MFS transporter [Yinghuangia sp. ASG 101]UGQ08930.1 MFS transporter [Yinghuangia sp. ASG 101]